jgi:hypothetical protein
VDLQGSAATATPERRPLPRLVPASQLPGVISTREQLEDAVAEASSSGSRKIQVNVVACTGQSEDMAGTLQVNLVGIAHGLFHFGKRRTRRGDRRTTVYRADMVAISEQVRGGVGM